MAPPAIPNPFADPSDSSSINEKAAVAPTSTSTSTVNNVGGGGGAKRMASTALPPAAPYEGVPKPWTKKPNPRAKISYFLTW